MKLAEHFNTFLVDVINLNQTRIDMLKARVDAIVAAVEGFDVYSDILIDTTPQGSWAHRTIIKPAGIAGSFDADVVAFVKPHDEWTPADYIDHLYDQFKAHGTYSDKVSRKTRCVTIPVGVARQVSAKPDTRYAILGIARVTHWKDGVFQLDGYASDGSLFSQSVDGPLAPELQATEPQVEAFDPASQEDARQRVLTSVVRRRGQSKFRAGLLRAYGGKCAITGCVVEAILEAAHVTPYLGPDTNALSNGILLRADLHTLWDLGLIAIEPISKTMWVSPSLVGSEYDQFAGKVPFIPAKIAEQLAVPALQQHWDLATKLA